MQEALWCIFDDIVRFVLKGALIVRIGQRIWLLGVAYEVVAVRGASIWARKASTRDLHWIIEDDLPFGTIVE
jgi:hypothetical protein